MIELDPQEVELCEYIGKLRSSIARGNNVFDAKIGDQNVIEADIQGFKAEYAFAKKNNLKLINAIHPTAFIMDDVKMMNNI